MARSADRGSSDPWRIDGQRVDFCVTVDPKHPTHTLRYIARVVTPGTYAWEPAVIQSSIVREHGKTISATKVVDHGPTLTPAARPVWGSAART